MSWSRTTVTHLVIELVGWCVCVGYGTWFSEPKWEWGRKGVKEKNQVSAKDAAKVVGVSSAVKELGLSSWGCSISINSTIVPNEGIVTNPPTPYAKLVIGEPTISERFANTIYGFFLGKRVAYPIVANYVKNTWSKYGLVKSVLNSYNGLFFFEFNSKDDMDAMLENGP
ncbi:zinc finger, CCHC-type containing protein [Tanacetum coccineum]